MSHDAPERCNIPDDAMINGEIVITSYFNTDGRLMYAVNITEKMNLGQALGLCELAKISIHEQYMMNEPYSPDDDDDEEEEDDDDD
jgi:hypothetical protein